MTDQPNQELPPAKRRRLIIGAVLHGLVVATVLVVLYYLLPLDRPLDAGTAVRLLIGLLVFAGLTVWQVKAIAGSRYPGLRAAEALGLIIPLYLLLFASTYFLMQRASAGNFTQPLTRTDALYFSVTVFTTVGFGDITAKSETARVVLIIQMLADLALLGARRAGAAGRGAPRPAATIRHKRRRRPGHHVKACPRPCTGRPEPPSAGSPGRGCRQPGKDVTSALRTLRRRGDPRDAATPPPHPWASGPPSAQSRRSVTGLLEATAGRWPNCLSIQHPAATRQCPASTKPDAPVARTHRICDPAYLHGRAHVGLEVSEIPPRSPAPDDHAGRAPRPEPTRASSTSPETRICGRGLLVV